MPHWEGSWNVHPSVCAPGRHFNIRLWVDRSYEQGYHSVFINSQRWSWCTQQPVFSYGEPVVLPVIPDAKSFASSPFCLGVVSTEKSMGGFGSEEIHCLGDSDLGAQNFNTFRPKNKAKEECLGLNCVADITEEVSLTSRCWAHCCTWLGLGSPSVRIFRDTQISKYMSCQSSDSHCST